MADTIREFIIQDIISRAALLIKGNGYTQDLADHVIRGRVDIDPKEAPYLAIIPAPETPVNEYGLHKITMPVRIEGVVEYGTNDPGKVAEGILGDLISCFCGDDWTRSPDYIDDISYGGGGTSYPGAGETVVGAYIIMNIDYWILKGNPFSQDVSS